MCTEFAKGIYGRTVSLAIYLLKFDPLLHVNTSIDKYARIGSAGYLTVTDPEM